MKKRLERPLAIAMWDFSWLERRWPGAGFESWEQALDELMERGYDAVRIDAYPHLMAADPEREWVLKPEWNQQVWGSPALNRISRLRDHLVQFMSLCKERNIQVALSTWFREDVDNTRMEIRSPESLASVWKQTLDIVGDAGLLDTIFYVDLCNEYCGVWAPFLHAAAGYQVSRTSAEGTRWMKKSVAALRENYPDIDYTFSFSDEFETLDRQDISFLNLLEPHVWMATFSDFNDRIGYSYQRFDSSGYENLALYGEKLYLSRPGHWQKQLIDGIDAMASWSVRTGKPLVTTECWSIVDYKDWPLLNWDWVKELNCIGVEHASRTGRWIAIATSNFCAPQFVGMWRDVSWHRRLTDIIHRGSLPAI